MVEHIKSADQIVAEAIVIHIDTEGIDGPWDATLVPVSDLEEMLYWALAQAGVVE